MENGLPINTLIFRPAIHTDSLRVAALQTDSWRDAYRGILPDEYLAEGIVGERARFWQSRLSSLVADRRHVLLAEVGGVLAGFVCVLLDIEPQWGACLDNLHVTPKLRRQGLGRQLFIKAAEWVVSMEPGWSIHLWVFEANHGARRFYDRLKGEVVERCLKELAGGARIPSLRYVWRDLEVLLSSSPPGSTGPDW